MNIRGAFGVPSNGRNAIVKKGDSLFRVVGFRKSIDF